MRRLHPGLLLTPAFVSLVGGAGIVVYFTAAGRGAQDVIYQLFSLGACVLLARRAWVGSAGDRVGWALLAAGLFCFTAGDAIWNSYTWVLHRDAPYPSIADIFYLAGYPFIALGILVALKRQRLWHVGELVENAVITASAGLVLWIFLIEPLGTQHGLDRIERLTSAAYPTVDVCLVAVLVQLTLPRAQRTRAGLFVGAAVVTQLVADAIYAWMVLKGTYVDGSWIDGGWMASYLFWAVAAVASTRIAPVPDATPRTSATRMWLLSLALLTAPVVLTVQSWRHEHLDLEAVLPTSTVLALLIFGRLVLLIKQQARAEGATHSAMAALQMSEERHRSLVEHLPLVVYAGGTSGDAGPGYVAPQFEEVFGYPSASWEHDPGFFESLIHPDDLAEARAARARVRRGEESTVHCEYRVRAADGREVWVLDAMTSMADDAGNPFFYQGFLLDISERRRLEAELRQAQRMEAVGQLTGGLAHDFNNIVMSISGHAELMLDAVPQGEPAHAYAEQVAFAADRAAELTKSLLAFSRRQILQTRKVDLADAIRQLEPMLRRLIGEDVVIRLDLGASPVVVDADAGQMAQVILNLSINARHAMPMGGTLSISLERDATHAIVQVSDTGQGMDAETRAHAFEPFFTTKGEGKGTGLGLSMAHGVVEQSGGTIAIESEVGRGTTITIRLPIADASASTQAPAEAPPTVGESAPATKRILLVEDDAAVRMVLTRMLDHLGYAAVVVDGPAEALERCAGADTDFELMITDVVMPEMHGTTLAELVHALRPQMSVLFISGYPSDEIVKRGGFASDQHFLQKPFTSAELAKSVTAACANGTAPLVAV